MNKITLGGVFQAIQIIALAFLVFTIMKPSAATKKLDEIEQRMIKITQQSEEIMKEDSIAYAKYFLNNEVQLKKIDSISNRMDISIIQLRKTNKNISDLSKVFKENKVELPNPDK